MQGRASLRVHVRGDGGHTALSTEASRNLPSRVLSSRLGGTQRRVFNYLSQDFCKTEDGWAESTVYSSLIKKSER